MTLILSHVHNHPLNQAENDSCPAYIIASTVNSDMVPSGLTEITSTEFNGTYLSVFTLTLYSQTVSIHRINRAPPFSC